MKKLIFEIRKNKTRPTSSVCIKIRTGTLELVEEVAEETKFSKQEVMDRMIRFAYENIEYRGDK